MTASANDGVHKISEAQFFFLPIVVTLNAVSTFHDENIWPDRWDLGFHEMAIFLPRIVTRIEDFEPSDIDEKHTCTQNVSCVIRGKSDTRARRYELMHGNRDDGRE
jgi:hypothetical protein